MAGERMYDALIRSMTKWVQETYPDRDCAGVYDWEETREYMTCGEDTCVDEYFEVIIFFTKDDGSLSSLTYEGSFTRFMKEITSVG